MLIRFFIAILLLTITINHADAAATQIVQPIGTVVEEWNPALVNEYLEKWDPHIIPGVTDPFDLHYTVSEVQPTKTMYFVRFYAEPGSGPLGSYIVRASVVRGLTPQQIRNILALPDVPTKMVYVKVPAGAQYGLWTGVAGPIMSPGHEWGQGGGEQTKIIGKQTNENPPPDPARFANYSRLPADSYMNPTFIGSNALSYSAGVNHGNPGKIAAYLDHHLPQPYSDMEDVYTTLDFINEDGPPQLAAALNQIGPVNFDAFSTVQFRNDLLFNNMLFEYAQLRYKQPGIDIAKSQIKKNCFYTWINISGEQDEQSQGNYRVGFNNETAALTGGADCRISSDFRVGVDAGYFHNHLVWNADGGNADINNAKVGIYSSYTNADYFLNSSLTGGFNWNSAHRNINFSGNGVAVLSGLVVDTLSVNRTATSNQTGQNTSLYFTGGKKFQMYEWTLVPMAQVSYFYAEQNAFNEKGADDLNLHVKEFSAQTIRTQLAVMLGKKIRAQNGFIMNANLQLGWAHNFPLDNRVISASLPALGGGFSINGYHEQTNEALASANLSTKMTKNVWVDAQYYADLSHGFNSQAFSLLLKYYLDA